MREQIAQQPPRIRRASLPAQYRTEPPPASRHRVDTRGGMHTEDMPTFTRTHYKAPPPDQYEEDDELTYHHTPRSAIVRHQPYRQVEPVTHTEEVDEPPRPGKHPMFYLGVSLLVAAMFVSGYIYIPPAWQRHVDDVTYGYPRTYQTDANVGHGGVSHFVVFNIHGTIEVLEIPSDPTKGLHLWVIVHFSSDRADLIPATVTFSDLNGDGKPDMEVKVYETPSNPSIWLLFNDGQTFKPKL